MKKLKYLYLSIFLIGISLIFLPQICGADMSVGFLMYSPPLLALVAFMGVWIIEALTIKDRLEGIPQKALFAALVVNLVTSLLGFLVVLVQKNFLVENILPYESLVLLVVFFLLSIFIEALILRFHYRGETWSRVTSTSFSMNLKSYLFLIIFLIGDIITIGGAIISIIIIPYFFIKAFKMLTSGKKLSKSFKIASAILIPLLSIILVGLVFIGVGRAMNKASFMKRARPREARVISEMSQIRIKAELVNADEGSYKSLNCDYDEEMRALCKDIEEQTGSKPTIHTSENGYCAYIKLIRSEEWYCIGVGASGYVRGRVTTDPSTQGYCDGITFVCPKPLLEKLD